MQAFAVERAFTLRELERRVFAFEPRMLRMREHHVGLGSATGSDLKTRSRTRGRTRHKLCRRIGHDSIIRSEHARTDGVGDIDRAHATRKRRRGVSELTRERMEPDRRRIGIRREHSAVGDPNGTSELCRKPYGNSSPAGNAHKLARENGIEGAELRRQIRIGMLIDAAQDRVCQARRAFGDGPHELHTLAHRHASVGTQVEHLERSDAQRHAHALGNFFGLDEKTVEQLVQAAARSSRTERQTQRERTVPRVLGTIVRA